MLNWYIKHFKSKVNAKVIFKTKEGRLRTFWAIPKNGEVTLPPFGVFMLDRSKMYLSHKNTPTYIMIEGEAEPLELTSKESTFMSPLKYQEAIKNRVVSQIIGASEDSVISKETMIILGVLVFGLLGLGYMFNDKLSTIIQLLTETGA